MKKITVIIVAVVLAIFCTTLSCLPRIGDPESAPNTHVTPHYIEHSYEDTGSPNIVTATLADYRGFDTLEETTVMFLAGMTAVLILRGGNKDDENHSGERDFKVGSEDKEADE